MTITLLSCRHGLGLRRAALAWLILLTSQSVVAQHSSPPHPAAIDTATVTAPTAPPVEPAKQCYNGCQRWGQLCNADPRGVYKCHRRCEKFGQICE